MKKELPTLAGSASLLHPTVFESGPRVTRTDYISMPDGSRVAVDFWTEIRLIRVDAPRPLRAGEYFPLVRGTPVRINGGDRGRVARVDYVNGEWLYEVTLEGRAGTAGLTVSGVAADRLSEVVNPGIAAV